MKQSIKFEINCKYTGNVGGTMSARVETVIATAKKCASHLPGKNCYQS